MSLAPCKKRSQNKVVTLEQIFRDRLTYLGIRKIQQPRLLKKSFDALYVKRCRRIVTANRREGAILILSIGTKNRLMAGDDSVRAEFFSNLRHCGTAMLVFSESSALPVLLSNELKRYHLPAAVAALHDHLLESRIKAVLQEKINNRITVHGVALEVRGRGILITGASGIGKTTAALQAVSKDCLWIADDLTVIKKKQTGQLMISGHPKIKKLFHTSRKGIMPVDSVVKPSQMKDKTRLDGVIELIRSDTGEAKLNLIEKKIIETSLPFIRITIPRTGFFNKNLLEKAILKLNEVG
jgi:serine kinase of HPr protein (carbohydrate metabolism regulator)